MANCGVIFFLWVGLGTFQVVVPKKIYRKEGECHDVVKKVTCENIKKYQGCRLQPKKAKQLCPETCGFCRTNCTDQSVSCKEWSRGDGCKKVPKEMENLCPASCGYCGPKTPCDGHKCPARLSCVLTRNMKPKCICKVKCKESKYSGPLCGINGMTFKNLCELKKEECKIKDFIRVKHYGQCINEKVCSDGLKDVGVGLCNKWKEQGACDKSKEIMQFYCAKTCRLCRQPAPPPFCTFSKFGCCWNTDKPALGPYQEGCQKCKDMVLCKYFIPACGENRNTAFMREFCPGVCHFCVSPKYKEG